MRHDQPVEREAKNLSAQKTNATGQLKPGADGPGWLFPLLMLIIGLGVLGLILKSLGLF
jgi:hypothetical protein